jgi:hypothetical protein
MSDSHMLFSSPLMEATNNHFSFPWYFIRNVWAVNVL